MAQRENFDPTVVYPPKPSAGAINPEAGKHLIKPHTRYPIEYLVERWKAGEMQPLNSLLKAFKMIRELTAVDQRSFTYIAGIHGQPFITRQDLGRNELYWGGYCAHQNVLFPVWHRAYVNYLERALQSVLPGSGVMMAFWDELGDSTKEDGVPEIFLAQQVWIDGKPEANPLGAFTFKMDILDDQPPVADSLDNPHIDYTTVRFPLFHSDIGSDEQQQAATELNSRYFIPGKDEAQDKRPSAIDALNTNVIEWLYGTHATSLEGTEERKLSTLGVEGAPSTTSQRYGICLSAETYTLFSNTTSMANHRKTSPYESYSLEQPHNDIHLAVGSFVPGQKGHQTAYGDMGFNETAAYDPIFYFHHAFVDRVFWKWQEIHDATTELTVDENDPGAVPSSEGGQGPSPGQKPDQKLNMNTPLYPFQDQQSLQYLTGKDMTDLAAMNIAYKGGKPLEPLPPPEPSPMLMTLAETRAVSPRTKIIVSNVDRALISGPFMVVVYLVLDDVKHYVGYETVFNRLVPRTCNNCMVHRYLTFVFGLNNVDPEVVYSKNTVIDVEIRGRLVAGAKLDYKAEFA